eukprot:Protomagalhaensia_sp_Gyna_25__2534@NODE_242_length_4215_cov_69_629550_g187_i0_p2_GENE_NODE_242_length_4215_cov_69_629550_g187_i0NODE_242_length_4215_cov_69_629550_g187_i0_p2_ORF_typecomplete_len264_score37_78_NODE_242_length_4215_cov_69_629550_g187_i017742565
MVSPSLLLPVAALGLQRHHHHFHHEEWPGLRFHENQYYLKDESGGSSTEHTFAFVNFSTPLTIGATATASGDPSRALLLLSRMEGLARTHHLLDPQNLESPRLFGLRWESHDNVDSIFGAGVALREHAKAPYHEDMTVLRNMRRGLYVTMRRSGLHSELEADYNVLFDKVFPKFSLSYRTIEQEEESTGHDESTEDFKSDNTSTEERDPQEDEGMKSQLPSGSPILEEFHNVPSTAVTWSHHLHTECFVPIQSVPDGVHVQRL